jgi:hypothetical protein
MAYNPIVATKLRGDVAQTQGVSKGRNIWTQLGARHWESPKSYLRHLSVTCPNSDLQSSRFREEPSVHSGIVSGTALWENEFL